LSIRSFVIKRRARSGYVSVHQGCAAVEWLIVSWFIIQFHV